MMKKFIAVGDIHGRDVWKKISVKNYEKVIFVGDYVDGWFSDEGIVKNLEEIINLKVENVNKVILLVGNHDLHYMFWSPVNPFRCSGFNEKLQPILTDIYNKHINYFQVAYQLDNFLFTHAGISNKWYNWCKEIIDEYQKKFETTTLADTLNIIFQSKDNYVLHTVSSLRDGRHPYGGITWADKQETKNDALRGYHQIVGHSRVRNIETHWTDENSKITYIDVLGTEVDFYQYPVIFEN